MIEFKEFEKIARLSRECIITEKIDGTNASILISDDAAPFLLESGKTVPFMVGSRTRWIFPEADNYGFARWAYEHAEDLLKLGPGHHYGEWWGLGVQRAYAQDRKRFSLFNTSRWEDPATRPACVDVVPILARGIFTTELVQGALDKLRQDGSAAAPGFMRPEGVVIYHLASRTLFKKTLEKDEQPKGAS